MVLGKLLAQRAYRGRLLVLSVFLPLAVGAVWFRAPWALAMALVGACMYEYQSVHPAYNRLVHPRAGPPAPLPAQQTMASSPSSPTFKAVARAFGHVAPLPLDAAAAADVKAADASPAPPAVPASPASPAYEYAPLISAPVHSVLAALLSVTAWFGFRAFHTAFGAWVMALTLYYTFRTGHSSDGRGVVAFHPATFYSLAYDVLGYFLTAYLLGHALLFHPHPHSTELLLFVILGVIAGENGAMVAGKNTSNPTRPWPQLSPKKTLVGAVAQVVTCVLFALVVHCFWSMGLRCRDHLALGVIIGVLSCVGDFVESYLKRSFGVKDIGTLLPGTGGMWDRVYGQIWAFWGVYQYLACCTDYGLRFPNH